MNTDKSLYLVTALILTFLTGVCQSQTKNGSEQLIKASSEKRSDFLKEAPGGYIINEDKDVVTIPFELFDSNKILINGIINGKRVKLLVDNGKLWDQVWFYNGEVDSLNLKYRKNSTGKVEGLGEEGGSDILEGNKVVIVMGDVIFNNQPTLISPPGAGFQAYFPGINGQVSSLFFKHFVVGFDFEKSVIILTKPQKFVYSGQGSSIPMQKRENGSYCIPMTFQMNGRKFKDYLIDIDLGTVFPLCIFENKKKDIRLPVNAKKHLVGYGASGKINGYTGMIDIVKIGDYTLDSVPAEFLEESKNSPIVETGTFGIPLMEKFNITFDYFSLKMYLEPNKYFGSPFRIKD